jgi:hypothetical protein
MSNTKSRGGIGFIGLLTILFIGLKLCGVIDWAWLWVLSPMWIMAIIVVLVLGTLFLALVSETPSQKAARLAGERAERLRNKK